MTQQTMTEKDQFLMGAQREYETTLRVLESYPADQLNFKPADSSQTAQQLMWTLCLNKLVVDNIIAGELVQGMDMPKPPSTKDELVAAFKKAHQNQMAKVKAMSDADFNGMMKIQTGKDQTSQVRRADALWFMAMDGIHHRGQFSVYLRMKGGHVPSIYGPSGDEPWG